MPTPVTVSDDEIRDRLKAGWSNRDFRRHGYRVGFDRLGKLRRELAGQKVGSPAQVPTRGPKPPGAVPDATMSRMRAAAEEADPAADDWDEPPEAVLPEYLREPDAKPQQ